MTIEYGKRLLSIRENIGLTLEDVAEKTKISKSTIQAYEAGQYANPNLAKLSTLCNFYGVSLSSILSDSKEHTIFTRASELSPSLDKENLSKITTFSEHYERLRHISSSKNISGILQAKMYPNDLSLDWWSIGDEIARDERRMVGHESWQPIDLISLIKGEERILLFSCELPAEIDGLFFASDDNLIFNIVLNSAADKASNPLRVMFTLAHEYAHFLLDRDERAYICANIFDTQDKPIEQRANGVGARLLLPTEGIQRYISDFKQNDRHITPDDVIDLCNIYETSYQTTIYRLHNEQFINANERDGLLKHNYLFDLKYRTLLNKLKTRFADYCVNLERSFKSDALSEVEMRYVDMVSHAFEKRKISYDKIFEYIPNKNFVEKYLNITPPEIEVDDLY